MKLHYRGIFYTGPRAIATSLTNTAATYRGHHYALHQPIEVAAKSPTRLTYRGVPYGDRYSVIADFLTPVYA